jgi:hypothetical protein
MSDKDLTPQVPGEEVQEEAAPEVVEPKPRAKGKAAAVKQDAIPDQADVNPDTIKRAVLTKQGWVVPTSQPAKVS